MLVNIAPPKTRTDKQTLEVVLDPVVASPDAADFDTDGFFAKKGVRRGNCYASSFLNCSGEEGYKKQPGDVSGKTPLTDIGPKSCSALVSRVLNDNPHTAYLADPAEPCQAGHYKVMMFAGNGDYHFWRQARNVRTRIKTKESVKQLAKRFGVHVSQIQAPRDPVDVGDVVKVLNANLFVHKPGHTAQRLDDSCGRLIKDPRTACRQSGDINYSNLCSTFCVRRPSASY